VQGREDLQAGHQRPRKIRKGLQEGRLASGSVVPIIAVQREQDALGTEMLGQVDGQGEYREIALRQGDMAHPFGVADEVITQSRKIHRLQWCGAGLGQTRCRRLFAPGVPLPIVDPQGVHWFPALPKLVQQRSALDPSREQQQ